MKLRFASVLICSFVATAIAQQQSPTAPPAVNQPTTPANQGVLTNPTGAANTPIQPGLSPIDNTAGAFGGAVTNPSASLVFGETNQIDVGIAPLFLNVTPTTITDPNGAPIGVLQQLALSPDGVVNFGIVNIGGRLVPVPWELIVTGTTRGTLSVATDRARLQTLPSVYMSNLPLLTQDEIQTAILAHFGLPPNTQPTIFTTGTPRGGTGGPGITLTGGSTNGTSFSAPTTNSVRLNTNAIPNSTRTNQAVNPTNGLLSPTGRTNAPAPPPPLPTVPQQ